MKNITSYNKTGRSCAKVPVLSDKLLHIEFSQTIVDVYNLRKYKPLGWEEKRLTAMHTNRTMWGKIESGEIDVCSWSGEYSIEERIREIESLKAELLEEELILGLESLDENNLENNVDFDNFDDILDDIENELS